MRRDRLLPGLIDTDKEQFEGLSTSCCGRIGRCEMSVSRGPKSRGTTRPPPINTRAILEVYMRPPIDSILI